MAGRPREETVDRLDRATEGRRSRRNTAVLIL